MEIRGCELDVICIGESWLKPELDSALIKIDGYNIVRQDREILLSNGVLKAGGGVCTYIADHLEYTTITEGTFCNVDLEMLTVGIKHPDCRNII